MARIRSIHPDQWTDDKFVSLTPYARLFALSVRNMADDNGVFVWNPVQLKIRLFPLDNVKIDQLIGELEEHNHVYRYSIREQDYFIIRNFQKFQSPKRPTFTHPPPDKGVQLPPGYELNKADSRISPCKEGIGEDRKGGERIKTSPAPEEWINDWPNNFPDELWNWFSEEGFVKSVKEPSEWMRTETSKMIDWAIGKGERKVSWKATWKNWVRRAFDAKG